MHAVTLKSHGSRRAVLLASLPSQPSIATTTGGQIKVRSDLTESRAALHRRARHASASYLSLRGLKLQLVKVAEGRLYTILAVSVFPISA